MTQHARLIVNPAAGAGRSGKRWPQIRSLLKDLGLRFDFDVTEAPGHATELARDAARNGHDMIVSVGGDGTLNEVVNGLYQAGANGRMMVGIIGTGTGSDYLRTVGVPRSVQEACRSLVNPRRMTVDAGVVEYERNNQTLRRLFVNFAGLGFDSEVVRATGQQFKKLGAKPAYLLGLLSTFLSYRNREMTLTLDGISDRRKVCTVVVSNGRYGGGGMLVAPNADATDGLLDVMTVNDISKPDLLWSLPRIYRGTHLSHPKVDAKRARDVEIRPAQPVPLQADGELLGEAPARFRILPAAVTLAVQTAP